jgi:hypothetical protein
VFILPFLKETHGISLVVITLESLVLDGYFKGLPDKEYYTVIYPESPGKDGLLIFSQLKISVMWDLAQHRCMSRR